MGGWLPLLLGAAMSTLGVSADAPAADAPVYDATYVEVAPPSTSQAAALLRQHADAIRKDAGCQWPRAREIVLRRGVSISPHGGDARRRSVR